MIMGHIGFGGKFDKFIHAFHMPMFFLISGIFYSNKYSKDGKMSRHQYFMKFLSKKITTLLMPYLLFSFAHYFLWFITNWNVENWYYPMVHIFTYNNTGLPYAGALWFLTALFISEVIYCFIDLYMEAKWKYVVILLVSFVGNVVNLCLPIQLPWSMSAGLVGVGLMCVGRLLSKQLKKKGYLVTLPKWMVLLSGVFITILIFLNGTVNMRIGEYGCIPLFWINAIGASIIGLNISDWIHEFCCKLKWTAVFDKWLENVGEHSLVYVCLNQITIVVVNKVVNLIYSKIISYSSVLSKLILNMIVLVSVLGILYLTRIIIYKIQLGIGLLLKNYNRYQLQRRVCIALAAFFGGISIGYVWICKNFL